MSWIAWSTGSLPYPKSWCTAQRGTDGSGIISTEVNWTSTRAVELGLHNTKQALSLLGLPIILSKNKIIIPMGFYSDDRYLSLHYTLCIQLTNKLAFVRISRYGDIIDVIDEILRKTVVKIKRKSTECNKLRNKNVLIWKADIVQLKETIRVA